MVYLLVAVIILKTPPKRQQKIRLVAQLGDSTCGLGFSDGLAIHIPAPRQNISYLAIEKSAYALQIVEDDDQMHYPRSQCQELAYCALRNSCKKLSKCGGVAGVAFSTKTALEGYL